MKDCGHRLKLHDCSVPLWYFWELGHPKSFDRGIGILYCNPLVFPSLETKLLSLPMYADRCCSLHISSEIIH